MRENTVLRNTDERKKQGEFVLSEKANKNKKMTRKQEKMATNSVQLYNVQGWGDPYFSVNKKGNVAVHPKGNPKKSVDLKNLVDQIVEREIPTPFLLRFNDILLHRLQAIATAFQNAVRQYDYKGSHDVVYPIKVNQQRHVVEQILKNCKNGSFGLEAGSKPELVAVMALTENPQTPIICNGYKDKEYFEIAMMGLKTGKSVYPVIEKFSEFKTMAQVGRELKIQPQFGVRVKLSSTGSGRWEKSGGFRSKFGLSITELLRGIDFLKRRGLLGGFKLLHFHLGSQITDIDAIKRALKEAARIYTQLKKSDVPLEIVDVGGGLGIDYEGTQTNAYSSMNYSLQEYANDVVFQIKEICDEAGVDHPQIFTECGRAVVAHHSVLVMNILGISGYDRGNVALVLNKKSPKPLRELYDIRQSLKKENVVEFYHDAVNGFRECLSLFNLGYMSLKERGMAEELFFSICKRCQKLLEGENELPEEFLGLDETLSDTYFCNLSIFQSLPDLWAIDHKFPIMPIHRLDEDPSSTAILADITCDSDGKIDNFICDSENKHVIKLHPHIDGEEYYLGAFLVGAYQETLGDLHNLFGDTNAVHVTLDGHGHPVIETVVKGDTVKEVLQYVQYDIAELVEKMHRQLENAVRKKKINFKESGQFLKFFETALEGYTYLEETRVEEEY